MILQLLVIDFPEAFPGACYDHFRPYLFSKRLHFSFGCVKGRSANEWMQSFSRVSAADAINILKRDGFAGIYVDRAQYEDRGQKLFEGFSKMDLPIVQSSRNDLFCVLLNPK
jgi:phosphoglycerol transferase